MSDLEDTTRLPEAPAPAATTPAVSPTISTTPTDADTQLADTRKEVLLNRVKGTAEIITDPESPSLKEFHAFLEKSFAKGEVEPLDVFKEELSRQDTPESPGHFICIVLRDPIHGSIVSCTYGSVQNGTIAIRFTLTEANLNIGSPEDQPISDNNDNSINYRGTGVSQEATRLLMKEANLYTQNKGQDCEAMVGEVVDRAEAYSNRIEIEPGNGRRRLYHPTTGKQVYYRLPPLAWNPDGTPENDDVITENLQVAMRGHKDQIPVGKLKEVLRDWWAAWYIRPKKQFQDEAAWEKHKKTVEDILENEIIAPISQLEYLTPRSKAERQQTSQS
jgi:hypothetical protein